MSLPLKLEYAVATQTLPQDLRDSFVALGPDAALQDFAGQLATARAGALTTLAHGWLRGLLSDFDINALLGVYPMHLLSSAQWRELLQRSGWSLHGATPHLLDIGAGSGDVTRALAPLFASITATERAFFAARRLRRRGFNCFRLDVAERDVPGAPFDAVACLNVLDRCPRPLTLLKRARELLRADGRLLIALTLPIRAFYYRGAETLDPLEPLPCSQATFEPALTEFVRDVLEPHGWTLASWTRTPYLSGGDASRPVFELDAAVMVARARD